MVRNFYVTCVYDISFSDFILKSFKIDKKILLYSVLQKPVLRMGYQISLTRLSKQPTIFDVCKVRLKCTYAKFSFVVVCSMHIFDTIQIILTNERYWRIFMKHNYIASHNSHKNMLLINSFLVFIWNALKEGGIAFLFFLDM